MPQHQRPTKEEIIKAEQRIEGFVHETIILTSAKLNELAGAQLFFKAEHLQKGGSFKVRGATNAVQALSKDQIKNGVATHSSGNHAQALAIAAKTRNIPAYVVMPNNAPVVKVEAVKNYGAHIIFCVPTLAARETTLNEVVREKEAVFIPPYNHMDIIAGQATMMKQFTEQVPDMAAAFIPIGGGGLISGSLLAVHYFNSDVKIYGAEPKNADDAYQSWKANKLIPANNPDTIADGLKTSLGDLTFPIIAEGVEQIITVTETEIIEAMKLIFIYLKQVVEPSAAVPLAALLKEKANFRGMKVGLILCGGNVDLKKLPF